MNEPTLKLIHAELSEHLIGQRFGKIFALSKLQMAIDFHLSNGDYLFASFEPHSPRIYLINRRLKQLSKQAKTQLPFVAFLRKRLANAILQSIDKIEDERILIFKFLAQDNFGKSENYVLVFQLTGNSSNLFLLDKNEVILDSLRKNSGVGQKISNKYTPPTKSFSQKSEEVFPKGDFQTISQALDNFYLEKEAKQTFQSKIISAESNLRKQIKKKKRLRKKLNQDLENHGKAENWKHLGDVLLANVATAERIGDKVYVIDYFDEKTPKIEIEVEENLSLTEAAEKFFKRYTKARNAKKEIAKRLEIIDDETKKLEEKKEKLQRAVTEENLEIIESFLDKKQVPQQSSKKKQTNLKGVRKFISSEGYEILVGKRSKDNDYLTFRIAKSLDTWLHAADYPGSHVVIRNQNRGEIPHQTLIEAAQIAAFYSKAKKETKAAVHYTQKKFVNKPKGAAAGLVSLSSFKTILVEPKIIAKKIDI